LKAVVLERYGPPEQLPIKDYPKPVPHKNQVLVKIHATAINDYDWSMVQGTPPLYRLLFGIWGPKHRIPGMELSGVVEAVGDEVNSFKPGDSVYGDISQFGFGTLAQYLAIDERALRQKPESMSFEQAAALPHAALLAYQSLLKVELRPGLKVLINGAGGGVGTLALQMLQPCKPVITGVDNLSKQQFMLDAGFDHVLDYRQTDFTNTGETYDLILDAKTTRGPSAYKRALNPGGVYVTVGGNIVRLLQLFLFKPFISKKGVKELHILALEANKGLDKISELYEAGQLNALIDGPYTLEDVPRLIQYFGEGKHRGKVIIKPW